MLLNSLLILAIICLVSDLSTVHAFRIRHKHLKKIKVEKPQISLFNSSWVSTFLQSRGTPKPSTSPWCRQEGLRNEEKDLGRFHIGLKVASSDKVYPTFIIAVLATSTKTSDDFESAVKLGRPANPEEEVVLPIRFSPDARLRQISANSTQFTSTATVYYPSCQTPLFTSLVDFQQAWNTRLASLMYQNEGKENPEDLDWRVPVWSQSESSLEDVLMSKEDPAFYTGLSETPFTVRSNSLLLWTPYMDMFHWLDSDKPILGIDHLIESMQSLRGSNRMAV